MKAAHVCRVCEEMFSYEYPPEGEYCLKCKDAINQADYGARILIEHLIKRIERLEAR